MVIVQLNFKRSKKLPRINVKHKSFNINRKRRKDVDILNFYRGLKTADFIFEKRQKNVSNPGKFDKRMKSAQLACYEIIW